MHGVYVGRMADGVLVRMGTQSWFAAFAVGMTVVAGRAADVIDVE